MLDGQGSRPDFRCSQGVKHENLLGQDLDRSRGWKYRCLCSVPPCFEAGQVVKLGIGGSLSTVKVSPGDRWAWLMLDSQGSRPDFRCGQGVKHGNLLGQDLDPGRGWKYRRSCSVPPLTMACS